MSYSSLFFFVFAVFASRCFGAPPKWEINTTFKPLMPVNFPDPAFIEINGTFYAFSTQSRGINVPMASTNDLRSMSLITGTQETAQDAMHALPPWTPHNNPGLWAPDVIKLKEDLFVLYFSATSKASQNHHCIGAATSQSVTGPYISTDSPLACPLKEGGAIDPSGFIDSDGNIYVVYKVDGNSLGGSGPCGNAEGTHPTPLMLQQVSADDGYTLIGDAISLLDRGEADGPLIEAPSLVRSADGTYVLFFSSNCYSTEFYDTSYATSASVKGPYTKSSMPLLKTGLQGLLSPGRADVLADGSRIVFHADERPSDPSVRQMYTSGIKIDGTIVSLA